MKPMEDMEGGSVGGSLVTPTMGLDSSEKLMDLGVSNVFATAWKAGEIIESNQVMEIEKLNVLKAYLICVNREDLIPVARSEHLGELSNRKWADVVEMGGKSSNQKGGRFGEFQDSLKLAKARGLAEARKGGGYTIHVGTYKVSSEECNPRRYVEKRKEQNRGAGLVAG